MALSMTAWGFYKTNLYTVNIRSLNSKYKEINLHLPQEFFKYEPFIYSLVNEKIMRGKIDVFINLENKIKQNIKINEKLFKNLYCEFKDLFKKTGIKQEVPPEILINNNIEGLMINAFLDNKLSSWTNIKASVLKAINNLYGMKIKEGKKLTEDILQNINKIDKKTKNIKIYYNFFRKKFIEQTREKIKEILSKNEINGLNVDIIQILNKFDINEEIKRIFSHIIQIRNFLLKNEKIPYAKKIDFLAQEIMREANTISSKVQDIEITKNVIEIKELTDKIREQVQNLE